jgi:hypothetical protein
MGCDTFLCPILAQDSVICPDGRFDLIELNMYHLDMAHWPAWIRNDFGFRIKLKRKGELSMASISNAHLEISPDATTHTAKVVVTCEVHFTNSDLEIMTQNPDRMHFSMLCWLEGKDLGEDSFVNTDDWLYSFASKRFPSGSPSSLEKVSFEATLGFDLLNEDVIGDDEIQAKLLLQGWTAFKGQFSEATTNLVKYDFG